MTWLLVLTVLNALNTAIQLRAGHPRVAAFAGFATGFCVALAYRRFLEWRFRRTS